MRARWVLAALLFVTFGAAVLVAGQRPPGPAPLPGVERLGPEPGEPVAHYAARAAASVPPAGAGPAWALVQFSDHLAARDAAEITRNVRLARVVLRVPLDRVQTALVTRVVPGQYPEAEIAAGLRSAASARSAATAGSPPGSRSGAVAAAEAARLRDGCACVVAALVHGDRAALSSVATQPQVRVVHAAEVGTPPSGLALAPLLPEQREVAGPVPDDGPVP